MASWVGLRDLSKDNSLWCEVNLIEVGCVGCPVREGVKGPQECPSWGVGGTHKAAATGRAGCQVTTALPRGPFRLLHAHPTREEPGLARGTHH